MAALGIQSDKAGTIKSALQNYKKNVDKINISTSKVNKAIKGKSAQQGINNYIKTVNTKIDSLLDFIKQYEARLDEVIKAYVSHDASSETELASAAKTVTTYKS